MRIVLEIDPVQMGGFNEAQRDFSLRVMSQSIRVPSVKDITEAYAKDLVDLAGPASKLSSVVVIQGVRRT